jgi:hypothetical protein
MRVAPHSALLLVAAKRGVPPAECMYICVCPEWARKEEITWPLLLQHASLDPEAPFLEPKLPWQGI